MAPLVIDIQKADDLRDVVHLAVQELAEGRIVAFPTETVYGLAVNARSDRAVASLLDVKGRCDGHPVVLGLKSADDALDYAPNMVPLARRLARRCWPGPITLVVDGTHRDSLVTRLPASVRAAVMPNSTVGLRVPAHDTLTDVLRMMAGPIVLTSANRAGKPDATTADQVRAEFCAEVSLVLDDGPSRYGQPSTVVKAVGRELQLLREGAVPEATVRRLASLMILLVCTGNTCRSPMADVIARQLLAKRLGCALHELDDHGVIVLSAGLAAVAGGRPSPEAARVVADMGLTLTDHASQPVTEQLVRHADIILTMTSVHREAIVSAWPEAAPRVQLLRRDGGDVPDPIGGPIEVYRQCAEQMQAELQLWIDELDIP